MSLREIIVDNHSLDVSFLNDSDFVRRGLEMAVEAHTGEFRKIRGEPFLTHCLGVVAITNKYDNSDQTQVRGLLHDIVDSPIARERISMTQVREEFGLDMVLEIASLSKSRVLRDELARRADYLRTTETETTPGVQVTRSGDKIHNLLSAVDELNYVKNPQDFWRHFRGGRAEYIRWPVDVLESIEQSGAIKDHPILDEYREAIEQLYLTVALREGRPVEGLEATR